MPNTLKQRGEEFVQKKSGKNKQTNKKTNKQKDWFRAKEEEHVQAGGNERTFLFLPKYSFSK